MEIIHTKMFSMSMLSDRILVIRQSGQIVSKIVCPLDISTSVVKVNFIVRLTGNLVIALDCVNILYSLKIADAM